MFGIFRFLKQCWIGEVSLAKSFWIVYILLNLVIIALVVICVRFISPYYIDYHGMHKFTDLVMALSLPYLIVSSTCVWIAGKNSWRIFNWTSKVIVVLTLIYISFHIIRLF